MDFDKTMNFTVERDKSIKAREILKKVYNSLWKVVIKWLNYKRLVMINLLIFHL